MTKVVACLAVLCVLVALACASSVPHNKRPAFHNWMNKHQKNYSSNAEYVKRFTNYRNNLDKAEQHNKANPYATFGETIFSDLSEDEFAAQYLTAQVPTGHRRENLVEGPVSSEPHPIFSRKLATPPNTVTFDWNSVGAITPVNDQGQCGSCWAFSAVETIESYHALKNNLVAGSLVGLSVEQVVDCDINNGLGDLGCGGGWPSTVYQYVKSVGGINSAVQYPYTASYGASGACQWPHRGAAVTSISTYASLAGHTGMYNQLKAEGGGPISVCVDASAWSSYTGGVITSCGTSVDHCVQVTGYTNYGKAGGYWNVRNQWGTWWGVNGYIYILAGHNTCLIETYPTVPVVTK